MVYGWENPDITGNPDGFSILIYASVQDLANS